MGLDTILLGLLGLGILVFFHELGHFAAARWLGIEVTAFSIGMGKVLLRKKWGDTEYRLSLIPLGGYCKMKGENYLLSALEDPSAEPVPEKGSFYAAAPWKRIIVSLAGPAFNLILTLMIFTGLNLTGYPYFGSEPFVQPLSTKPMQELTNKLLPWTEKLPAPRLPAEKAGLVPGDKILEVEGKKVDSFQDFQEIISGRPFSPLTLKIQRSEEIRTLVIQPIPDPRPGLSQGVPVVGLSTLALPVIQTVKPGSDSALAGLTPGDKILTINAIPVASAYEAVSLMNTLKGTQAFEVEAAGVRTIKTLIPSGISEETYHGLGFSPLFQKPGLALSEAFVKGYGDTLELVGGTLKGLAQLFVHFNFSESLSGPIGVVVNTGSYAGAGFQNGFLIGLVAFMNLMAFLSIGLFIMNLLPIPVLDGGTVLINLAQMAFPKPFKPLIYIRFQQVGMVFLFGILIFTTINDLIKLPL